MGKLSIYYSENREQISVQADKISPNTSKAILVKILSLLLQVLLWIAIPTIIFFILLFILLMYTFDSSSEPYGLLIDLTWNGLFYLHGLLVFLIIKVAKVDRLYRFEQNNISPLLLSFSLSPATFGFFFNLFTIANSPPCSTLECLHTIVITAPLCCLLVPCQLMMFFSKWKKLFRRIGYIVLIISVLLSAVFQFMTLYSMGYFQT